LSSGSYDKAIRLTAASTYIDKVEATGLNPKIYFLSYDTSVTSSIILNDFTVFEAQPEDINNDPTLNFVDTYRSSVNLFDADYSQGTTIPVNQQVLLSGSATKATVPDSNYTMARSTNPRYFGSKLQTYDSRSASESYPNYFGYFQYIELVDSSVGFANPTGRVKLTALIDVSGSSFTVDNRGNNIGLVQDIFTSGSPVTFIWPSVDTGSASTGSSYNVLIPGGITGPLTLVPTASETIVTIDDYYDRDTSRIAGIVIPPNFNPYFTGSFVELAQNAGFFKNL